jgi:hypothetical protein
MLMQNKNEVKLYTYQKKNRPAYNTDNMGKLFVTVFAFATATKTELYRLTNPDRAIARNKLNCTWIID